MKIKGFGLLLLITAVFAAFTGGFFVGRNFTRAPLQITEAVQSAAAVPEPSTMPAASEDATEPVWPLNINTATAEQLDALPGIGPVIAQRIVDYRNTYGPFTQLGQLTYVEGIGTSRLEQIWAYITLGGE